MKRIIILQILFLLGCAPENIPNEQIYSRYTESVDDYSDTIIYAFYGWPPSLDSFHCKAGVLRIYDNKEFICVDDTFSIYRYSLLENGNTDTTFFYFHHSFSSWRSLVFIKRESSNLNQMIIDSLQYDNNMSLYNLIESDTSRYFLNKDSEVNSRKHYEESFL